MSSRSTIPRTNGSVQVDTSCPVRLSPHRLLRGVWIPMAVIEAHQVSLGARLVYGLLAYHARRSDHCWPSIRRLASMLGVSRRQVMRYIAELEQGGWITAAREPGRASVYWFLLHPSMQAQGAQTGDTSVTGGGDIHVTTPVTSMSPPRAHLGEQKAREVSTPPSPPQGGAKNRRGHKDQSSVTRDLTARAIEYARQVTRTSSSP
jgi:hypothetical protein